MLVIGLTGGIGSGKTEISFFLEELGVSVLDADLISRNLTKPGGRAIPAIERIFGKKALKEDGSLNRSWMRKLIFSEFHQRIKLETILHPLIRYEIDYQMKKMISCDYSVLIVPLLIESISFWKQRVDRICVIDCDVSTQISRVRMRSGLSENRVKNIISTQSSRNIRLSIADDIILNNWSTSLKDLRKSIKWYHLYWSFLSKNF